MRCEEVMKRDVHCVTPQDTVQDAAKRMRDENVGFLPVCDASSKVVGTITDRDLTVRVLSDARAVTTPLDDVLTRDVVACRPEDELETAEQLMAEHHKSRMLCVDQDGKLLGVISLSDIAQREEGAKASKVLQDVSEREAHA